MAEPTLLSDEIHPVWMGLTADQRICWHFWAAAHPVYDHTGRLRTLYGAQAHYSRNRWLAVSEGPPMLADPPAALTQPPVVKIDTAVWPLKHLRGGGGSANGGLAYLALKEPNNNEVVIIIRQGYTDKKTGQGRPPRIRHVTVIQPDAAGPWDLTVPLGYFASTGGRRKFSVITGKTARRRPDKPLGSAIFIDINSGEKLSTTLSNPFGGSHTKSNRARATAVDPDSGTNHFP